MNRLLVMCVAAGSIGCVARGDIAFDTISTFTPLPTQSYMNLPIQAEDVTLDAAAGLTPSSVEFLTRLRSGAPYAEFSGTMTMRVYAGGAFMPGEVLAEATIPLTVARGTNAIATFNFAGFTLPSSSFFIGWFFTMAGQANTYGDMWVVQNAAAPTVGQTGGFYYAASAVTPNWAASSGDRIYALRVTTVPGPAPACAAALACAWVGVRRRRGA